MLFPGNIDICWLKILRNNKSFKLVYFSQNVIEIFTMIVVMGLVLFLVKFFATCRFVTVSCCKAISQQNFVYQSPSDSDFIHSINIYRVPTMCQALF